MSPPSSRHIALESLRSLAALAVVGVHVAAVLLVARPGANDSQWWSANLWDSFLHWCVPVFVMISGAVLLGRQEPAGVFWRKRLTRLLWPLLGWSLIYPGLQAGLGSPPDLPGLLASLLRGVPYYHLWYLWMLPGLYLLTPWLRQWLVQHSRARAWGLCVVLCALAALEVPLGWSRQFFLASSLAYLGCYLLGWLLSTQPRLPSRLALCSGFVLCGLGVALGVGLLRPALGEPRALAWMYAYPDPLVLGMGACVFMLGLRCRQSAALMNLGKRFAPLSLGIYLIHPLGLLGLTQMGLPWPWLHPAWGVPVLSLLLFGLSAGCVAWLQRLPGVRRLVA